MESLRIILFIALCFVLLMLWQAWQADYGAPRSAAPPVETAEGEAPPPSPPPAEDLPAAPAATTPEPAATTGAAYRPLVTVRTDVLELAVDPAGGTIVEALLLDYPIDVDQPDQPFPLMRSNEESVYKAQGGLLAGETGKAPDHRAVYQVDAQSFALAEGSDRLEIPMEWRSPEGVRVRKTLVLTRGSHVIDVRYRIDHQGTEPWGARLYSQLQRSHLERASRLLYTFSGAAYSSPEQRYKKIDQDELREQDLSEDIQDGWIALLQHYFVVATVPPSEDVYHYYSDSFADGRYLVGYYGPTRYLEPGEQLDLSHHLYIGPKVQRDLAALAPGLDLTVDYGWLWFIARPLFVGLEFLHRLLGNWGGAIIVMTFLIKLVFYPLSAASYRSMANMRRVQPRMMSIKERYGGDRAAMNQAMMELYKKEQINPLGGCLPILVQIPVFIALYWVLLESVELRQAPFFLWIRDLSAPDPFFVLPLLMGISMFIQHKLNPAPLDPVQAKVMQMLPIIFTVFFAFFPAGLVLYWVVNNVLSILQQWVITRRIEAQ